MVPASRARSAPPQGHCLSEDCLYFLFHFPMPGTLHTFTHTSIFGLFSKNNFLAQKTRPLIWPAYIRKEEHMFLFPNNHYHHIYPCPLSTHINQQLGDDVILGPQEWEEAAAKGHGSSTAQNSTRCPAWIPSSFSIKTTTKKNVTEGVWRIFSITRLTICTIMDQSLDHLSLFCASITIMLSVLTKLSIKTIIRPLIYWGGITLSERHHYTKPRLTKRRFY